MSASAYRGQSKRFGASTECRPPRTGSHRKGGLSYLGERFTKFCTVDSALTSIAHHADQASHSSGGTASAEDG